MQHNDGFIVDTLPAGGTKPYAASGDSFYVGACAGVLQIRPRGGTFATYVMGTGLRNPKGDSFSALEVNNPGNTPLGFQLWVGRGGFIDKRLYSNPLINPYVSFTSGFNLTSGQGQTVPDQSGNVVNGVYLAFRTSFSFTVCLAGFPPGVPTGNDVFQFGYGNSIVNPIISGQLSLSAGIRFFNSGPYPAGNGPLAFAFDSGPDTLSFSMTEVYLGVNPIAGQTL